MTGLIISLPGGTRVASEEVLLLEQCLGTIQVALDDVSQSLQAVGGAYQPNGLVSLRRRAGDLAEDVSWMRSALMSYTEQVAWQEGWRREVFEGSRNTLAALWVRAAAVGAASMLRDSDGDGSLIDDAAAELHRASGVEELTTAVRQVGPTVQADLSQGVAQRLARIPEQSSPIRIERYELADGSSHTEVFIAGTRTWDPRDQADPFDLHSNLALVGGGSSAAVAATTQALSAAGVRPGDRVVFVGHSQGGAVAQALAESGHYQTEALITAGAPLGGEPVRGDYPALRIEHSDDAVPDLAGRAQVGKQTTVTTESAAAPFDLAGAHSRESYLATAKRIDLSPLTHLSAVTAGLPPPTEGQVWLFDATRGSTIASSTGAGRTSQ